MNGGRRAPTPEQASLLAAHGGDFELLAQRLSSRELTDVEIFFLVGILRNHPYPPFEVMRSDGRRLNLRYYNKRLAEGARVYELIQEGHDEAEAYKIADSEFRHDKEGQDLKRFRKAYKDFKASNRIRD